jgi:hypothetical protein
LLSNATVTASAAVSDIVVSRLFCFHKFKSCNRYAAGVYKVLVSMQNPQWMAGFEASREKTVVVVGLYKLN